MVIVKAPFRISFFGGSTDYKDFYEKQGSFLIGATIDKYVYLSMRKRPSIFSKESVVTYSKLQHVKSWEDVENPLIREVLKYRQIQNPIEFLSFSDIPSRTGLGGSSSFCVGMLYLINKVFDHPEITKKGLVDDAIYIERHLLNEPGGIQDQIWPAYGGLNTIEIKTTGDFLVKPLPVTPEFKKELERSMVLIYTNEQREQNTIAKSHENKDKSHILGIAKNAQSAFLKEDIKNIGLLLFESWVQKRNISNLISTSKVDTIIKEVLDMGAYGAKLLGSGGCGFILVICDPYVKHKIKEVFKDNIMEFGFSDNGVTEVLKH
jgi:D-glycero-alpha-D-manno-heptose-7-phosphate kinase